jgi:hypothetical protein
VEFKAGEIPVSRLTKSLVYRVVISAVPLCAKAFCPAAGKLAREDHPPK